MIKKILNPLLLFFILLCFKGVSQCPQFFDGTGVLSSNPSWVNCSGGSSYELNLSSPSSFGSYSINWGDGSAPSNGSSYAALTAISHNYAAINDSFLLIITTNAPVCTITGSVYAKDVISISVDGQIKCTPSPSFTFSNSSQHFYIAQGSSTQRYEKWNFHDYWSLGHDSVTGWSSWPPPSSQTITFSTAGPHNVTLIDSTVCGLDSVSKGILVVNAPVAGIAAPVDTACPGTTLTFNNLSSTGATYRWNFGENTSWATFPFGNVNHTFNNPGTYTVSVAAIISGGNSACKDTARVTVFIPVPPVSLFSISSASGCDSLSVAFTNNSSPGATSWSWLNNGTVFSSLQSPVAQTYTVGTYTVSLAAADAYGCTNSSQHVVTVYQSPLPAFTNGVICQNSNAQFTDNSASAAGDALTSWLWDFGDGSATTNLQNPSHVYTNAGTFTVSLDISTAHCSATIADTLMVNVQPAGAFTINPSSGCAPLTVNFNNSSIGAINYSWDFGNGFSSSSINPSSLYTNSTTVPVSFTISLIAVSSVGCADTAFANVTVPGKPQAIFNLDTSSGCAPLGVNFSNGSSAATIYSWDFGDGGALSSSINPGHIFQNTTSVITSSTVSLIAKNADGCSDTATQVVQILPEANYAVAASPGSGCGPLTVNFTPSGGAVNYNWDFDDGSLSSASNPSHEFTNTSVSQTIFTVQLIAKNSFGCSDTTTTTITVFGKPAADFVADALSGCPTFPVNFTNTSSTFTSCSWNFGDGSALSSSANPSHNFPNTNTTSAITYSASLIVFNADGCSDTAGKIITVQPAVNASFAADTSVCAEANLILTNNSAGAISYNWNFGDGNASTQTSPSHVYTNTGMSIQVYTVTLIAEKNSTGCTDTIAAPITVYPKPLAAFTANPANQLFPSSTVNINNATANPALWTYSWDFGNGSNSNVQQPGSATYATWGNYTISLIASSVFCADTATQGVTIIPPAPVAGFTGSFTGCAPFTVSFTNTSAYATSYNWKFGDGGTSTQINPSYTYTSSGTFNVELTATGPGGTNHIVGIDSVVVSDKPKANFTASPTLVYIPSSILSTTNLSTNAIFYTWDFGDGDTSTLFSPTHIYATEGNYQITLIAENNIGCSDTFLLPVLIKAEAQEDVIVPNAFSPNPNSSDPDGSYDPFASDNDIFHPLLAGAKKFEMRIYNRWGELIFLSEDVNKGWDGYYKGKLCTQDIYIWKIVAETYDDKRIDKAGDVFLIR